MTMTSVQQKIREANKALGTFLSQAGDMLSGRQAFSAEALRTIAGPLEQMAPVATQGMGLSAANASLAADLQEYTDKLSALQGTLEKLRFMLLARQSSLQASRNHMETLTLWTERLNETR